MPDAGRTPHPHAPHHPVRPQNREAALHHEQTQDIRRMSRRRIFLYPIHDITAYDRNGHCRSNVIPWSACAAGFLAALLRIELAASILRCLDQPAALCTRPPLQAQNVINPQLTLRGFDFSRQRVVERLRRLGCFLQGMLHPAFRLLQFPQVNRMRLAQAPQARDNVSLVVLSYFYTARVFKPRVSTRFGRAILYRGIVPVTCSAVTGQMWRNQAFASSKPSR